MSNDIKLRTVEAFKNVPTFHPLVAGHMCKQDKNGLTFSKRYFALYKGGLLVYYSHEMEFENDVKKHHGIVSKDEIWQIMLKFGMFCVLVFQRGLDTVYVPLPLGCKWKSTFFSGVARMCQYAYTRERQCTVYFARE